MAMVDTAATKHVAARVAAKGGPKPWRGGALAKVSIAGLTKMMYAITMNVVTPASTSVPTVVPRWRSKKNASIGDGGVVLNRSLVVPGVTVSAMEHVPSAADDWGSDKRGL